MKEQQLEKLRWEEACVLELGSYSLSSDREDKDPTLSGTLEGP